MAKSPICLNMIVKNETPVLERLITSVKDIIDYYIIVDTGSDDGTPEFIHELMARYQIPGQVFHETWVNFEVNRNQALQYACHLRPQGWLLLIDADEELHFTDTSFVDKLQPGITYCLSKHHGNIQYALPNLIDISQNRWQWQGVIHECLQHVEGPGTRETLEFAWIEYHSGQGIRSRGLTATQKFLADAAILEKELLKNSEDSRSQFYLAQSYRDAGNLPLAYFHYLKRISMQGWIEEVFYAQYQMATIAIKLNYPYADIMDLFHKAYQLRPTRAEPLFAMAQYCRSLKQYHLAYLYIQQGLQLPYPKEDLLFVNHAIYHWQLLDELSVSGYWSGHFNEAKMACEKILCKQKNGTIQLEPQIIARVQDNLQYANAKLV